MAATELLIADKGLLWLPNALKWDLGVDNHTNYPGIAQIDTAGLSRIQCVLSWSSVTPTSTYVTLVGGVEIGLTDVEVVPTVTMGRISSIGADQHINADTSFTNGFIMAVWEHFPRYVAPRISAGNLSAAGHSVGTWYGTP